MATKTLNLKQFLSFFLVLFLFVGQLAVFQLTPNVKANPGWLSGWQYRKSHVITNATGAGTNYTVRIKAHYVGTDCFANNGVSQPFNFINYPSAVYHNGKTYVVWQGGDNTCDPYITYYDHSSDSWGNIVKIADNPLTEDDHGCPIICVDANGYLHVFYGCHSTSIKHAKSNNAEDISGWTIQSDPAASATYPKVIADGNNIYLFYRKQVSASPPHLTWVYKKSTDNGASWGSENTIIDFGDNTAIYAVYHELKNGKIHLTWDYYNYSDSKREDVFHAYLNLSDNNMYSMGGTNLGTTIDHTEANNYCRIIDSGTDTINVGSLHLDSNDYPWITYLRGSSGNWTSYHVRWNGSSWTTPQEIIANTSRGGDFIIHSTTNIELYIENDGDMEKWNWNGSSWSKVATVLESSDPNIRLGRCLIPINYNSELKVVFCEYKVEDWTIQDLKLYAYDGSNLVSRSNSGEDVYLNSKCRTDFGDVRFTDDDGTTLLDYWMEEKVDGDYAVFWVEVADDLSSSDVTIYIYYGKSDATYSDPQQHGEDTFLFFDDFGGTSLDTNKWQESDTGGSYSVSDSVLTIKGPATETIRSLSSFSYGKALGLGGLYVSDVGVDNLYFHNGFWDFVNTDLMVVQQYSSEGDRYGTYNTAYETTDFSGFTSSHKYEICWKDGAQVKYFKEGILEATHTSQVTSTDKRVAFRVGGVGATASHWIKVDYVYLRKYVDPEPSHGSWGTEEEIREYSYTLWAANMTHTTMLNQLQEQLRTWIETVYPSATMNIWREVSYTYTQTITATETVTYYQEHIRIMQESLSPTETMEHTGEGVFTFTQTITPSETVTYLQEQQYILTEKAAPTTTFEHWIEGINVFTETFTETLYQTATVHYWIEISHTLTETLNPQTLLETVGEIVYVLTETLTETAQNEIAQELLQTIFETLKPTTVFNYAKELVETFITNIETLNLQGLISKTIELVYAPTYATKGYVWAIIFVVAFIFGLPLTLILIKVRR